MTQHERPGWAYDGAQVYRRYSRWAAPARIEPRTIVRATATQLIAIDLHGNEERYYLKNLQMLGNDKVTLVPPGDPDVLAAYRAEAVRRAMADLREVFDQLQHGAQIMRNDLDTALGNATLIRDAAEKAVNEMKEIR